MSLNRFSSVLLFLYEASELLISVSEADFTAIFIFMLSLALARHRKDKHDHHH